MAMNYYRALFRVALRHLDPELAHTLALPVIRAAAAASPVAGRWCAPPAQLRVRALGLEFASPFGLAAGFDKNAEAILGLGALGFGHVEVGTLTRHAQAGNPQPRLFRLVNDRALINRMGFNNRGVAAAVPHIERAQIARHRPVIGVNIGKSRRTPLAEATEDYVYSASRLAPIADYLAINVSSPNTPGLRGLQTRSALCPLLAQVQDAAGSTPVLVKIAPDLGDAEVEEIVTLARELHLAGIIASNTTTARDGLRAESDLAAEPGGLSGAPLAARSLAMLQHIRQLAPDPKFCVISVGGVADASDVLERLRLGATLVQGFTGFIYQGPMWAQAINRGLLAAGYRSADS